MRYLLLTLIGMGLIIPSVHARPVSYPGGWTFNTENNSDVNSVLIHYSPSAFMSLGLRTEHFRDTDNSVTSLQMNNLLKRWNKKHSQANFYLKSGLGIADSNGESSTAAFTGIALDWENRRHFVSYENRYTDAGHLGDSLVQRARVGITPYIAGYGALHTWLMLELKHDSERQDDKYTVTPLIRLFKSTSLLELGVNDEGDALLNFTYRL